MHVEGFEVWKGDGVDGKEGSGKEGSMMRLVGGGRGCRKEWKEF